MAAMVGQTFAVGSTCVQTGRYLHTACTNTAVYNAYSNKFAPCQNPDCKRRGTDWQLIEKLT